MLDKPEVLAEVTKRPRFLPWQFDTIAIQLCWMAIHDRYSIFFRKTGPASAVTPSPSQKYTLKKVTSSIRLQNVFRRVSHGGSNNKQTEAEQVHKLVFEMKKNIFFCLFQRTRPIYKDFLKKYYVC